MERHYLLQETVAQDYMKIVINWHDMDMHADNGYMTRSDRDEWQDNSNRIYSHTLILGWFLREKTESA